MTKAVNLATVGSNANSGGTLITSGTAVTASGTAIDFTGIPSWVKRITVMFNGVSTNGSATPLIQLGGGSITSSGYNVYSVNFGGAGLSGAGNTTGFSLRSAGSTDIYSGSLIVSNLTSNVWVGNGIFGVSSSNNGYMTVGGITLGSTLDRIRITTSNGTDTFDAGSINILYE